jgi:hypothetical protein
LNDLQNSWLDIRRYQRRAVIAIGKSRGKKRANGNGRFVSNLESSNI